MPVFEWLRNSMQRARERWRSPDLDRIKLVSLIIAIIGLSITIVAIPAEFGIDIKPMLGDMPVPPGGEVQTSLSVYKTSGIPFIKEYNKPITLGVANVPTGVKFGFNPAGAFPPAFTSIATIKVGANVPEDQYAIDVWATGSDGQTHSTKFILYVSNGTDTSEIQSLPVPTPTSGDSRLELVKYFYPSGWMGNENAISFDGSYLYQYRSYPDCVRIQYTPRSEGDTWAGIYWQYPDNNWGNNSMGLDLRGRTTLTFWVKGETGGEEAEFKVGGIDGNARYPDSIQPSVSTGIITLTSDWKQYTINLSGQDLSHVIGGFCWTTNTNQNPNGATVFLDDITFA